MTFMSEPLEFLAPWWEVKKNKKSFPPKPPDPPVRKERVSRIIWMTRGDINNFGDLSVAVSEARSKYCRYGVGSFRDFLLDEWEGEYDAAEPVLKFITTETDEELAIRQKKYEVKLAKWKEKYQE